ncbi:lipopolysaccharide biosynthesis protein [Pedobacter sp. KR3-3]|uniref:Lipopolysaccharide biosynthesis protein n=1 Tax=Pedobacter albus TaxID=3113905 RepID=A0ABU7IBK8_9SPHI|nr:lipopolysaccharide biosynthesis protein [Pedobacter sp. KR3-3]MEE1946844.1 lipopolysaccharide biosynthesis protein [Pedobacter sp. KR3-3]
MKNKISATLNRITKDHRERRIILTSIATMLAKVINAGTLFVSIPLTRSYLGPERFGMMMSIVATIAVLGIADLGLGFGLQNRIAYYDMLDKKEDLSKAVSGTFFFLFLLAVALIAVFFGLKDHISWVNFFNVKEKLAKDEAMKAVEVFFICFSLSLPFSIVQKIQDGYQEGYFNQFWIAGGNVFGLIVLTFFIKLKFGVPLLILALYGTGTLFLIFNFLNQFIFKRPSLFPSIKNIDFSVIKSLMRDGMKYFILQFSAIANSSSDNIIIARGVSPIEVGIYTIGQRLVNLLTLPVQVTTPSMLPALNDAFAKKEYTWANKIVTRNFRILIMISCIGAAIMLTSTNFIVHHWIGKDFNLSSELILGFIALLFFYNLNAYFSIIILTSDYLKFGLRVYPLASLLSIVLKSYLVGTLGVNGVIISQFLCYSLIFFIPVYIKFKNKRKL